MGVRLAQIFDVNDNLSPLKASLFLKRVGSNLDIAFDLTNSDIAIDATNFSELVQEDHRYVYDETDTAYTGSGCLVSMSVSGSVWPIANYPIRTLIPGKYYLYIRVKCPSGTCTASIYIDGVEVDTVSTGGLGTDWVWVSANFVLPDANVHQLGISLKENGAKLDKLEIKQTAGVPLSTGLAYPTSPFNTIHLLLYQVSAGVPTTPLFVHDYKTTLDEVKVDDWYNFRLAMLDGTTPAVTNLALVLSVSGGSESNFIIWELVDTDEYSTALPSAIKVNNA